MSLEAIGIVSTNIKESSRFYKLLGIQFSAPEEKDHWEGRSSTGLRIMLDSVELVKKINPHFKMAHGDCGIVLCFKQTDPEKVDALYSQISKAGFKTLKPPWDAFWRQRYASVLDPDNNQIDIFAWLPS